MVLSTPVISYRNSPPLSYGATPRRIMDPPAEPRPAVVAAALLGYAILSIAMTLAFKAALQAFPYPASLVAATFVVEAALVKSAECGARAAACVFPKEETNEPRKCCVFPDETDRLLMYVACCVGGSAVVLDQGLERLLRVRRVGAPFRLCRERREAREPFENRLRLQAGT